MMEEAMKALALAVTVEVTKTVREKLATTKTITCGALPASECRPAVPKTYEPVVTHIHGEQVLLPSTAESLAVCQEHSLVILFRTGSVGVYNTNTADSKASGRSHVRK